MTVTAKIGTKMSASQALYGIGFYVEMRMGRRECASGRWEETINATDAYKNTVTCIPIARQRLGKHIPAQANARDNRTYQ
jgi:hypothetical protein